MAVLHHAVSATARRHHGVLTVDELVALGCTPAQVRRALDRGELTRRHAGVLVVAAAPPSWEQRLLVATHAGGPGTLASHRSAAALWGLDGSTRGRPEVVTPRHLRSWASHLGKVHESTDLHLAQPVERLSIPCTGIIPDSHFNRLVEVLLDRSGAPAPTVEHEVRDAAGRFVARVDLAYPELRIAIELDGKRDHMTGRAFEHDRARQNRLELEGWLVLRYTWKQFVETPDRIAAEVLAAIAGRRRAA